MTTWPELDAVFQCNSSFLISSHVNMDGDCIGSQLAMYWYLTSIGKRVVLFSKDSVPGKFLFLTNANVFTSERPQEKFDVGMVLDASNPSRLGWEGLREMSLSVVNIDHHRDNSHFGEANVVKPDSAATGQIIAEFFAYKKLAIPAHVAESLYTAIMTDTGGFRFPNTNGDVLRICAGLIDKGANASQLYEKVYSSFSPNGLMLRSKIWSTLTFYNDNKVCSVEMPYNLIKEMGATYGDAEGMSDLTVQCVGVQVGMLIKYDDKETHFSLRSRGGIDVGKMAQNIPGGGGHAGAAGCTMQLPCKQAKQAMLDMIAKLLV